jgi:hypothetical protein
MNQKWAQEEAALWNAVGNWPLRRDLAYTARRVRALPAGKNKTKLQQALTKQRAKTFAAEWNALDAFIHH